MVDGMRDAVADRVGGSVPVLLTPYGGPEALFRLGRIAVDDTGASAATMAVGPWLVVDGRPAAGSLGVLMDDVLGQAVIVGRPEGHWAVTTELTVDVCAPLPSTGRLHAAGELVSVDDAGGIARGTVRDDTGHLVAVGTTWSRYIPFLPEGVRSGTRAVPPTAGDPAPHELLHRTTDGVVIGARPEFGNPGGVVHGGLLTWVAELASRWLVGPSALHTASIRTAYVRPAIAPVVVATRIVHGGRSFTVIEAVARARDGRPCTLATVTLRAASLG
jgi:acyl-coenzyme A thioesterase PaaI-like protein